MRLDRSTPSSDAASDAASDAENCRRLWRSVLGRIIYDSVGITQLAHKKHRQRQDLIYFARGIISHRNACDRPDYIALCDLAEIDDPDLLRRQIMELWGHADAGTLDPRTPLLCWVESHLHQYNRQYWQLRGRYDIRS